MNWVVYCFVEGCFEELVCYFGFKFFVGVVKLFGKFDFEFVVGFFDEFFCFFVYWFEDYGSKFIVDRVFGWVEVYNCEVVFDLEVDEFFVGFKF